MKHLIPVLCAAALFAGGVSNDAKAEAPEAKLEGETGTVVDGKRLQNRKGTRYLSNEETGVAVIRYENGQKKQEATYKDGKLISKKHGMRRETRSKPLSPSSFP